MSQRQRKASYWQDAPMPRDQLVLITTALEEMIPADHPVRLVDEILSELNWTTWEAAYHGSHGQPPIHPSVMAKICSARTSHQTGCPLRSVISKNAASNSPSTWEPLSRWTRTDVV